ncbi:MAG: MBL fold metallo-hydrolase [Nitrosopumilus sp.]
MNQTIENLGVTATQLAAKIYENGPLILFDLRDIDEFEKSHIAGSVHAVCDVKNKETIMPKIPKKAEIILISDPDEFAKNTAQMMTSFGLNANYLIGGFSNWIGQTSSGKTGKTITADELLKEIQTENVQLVDVRSKDEFSEFKIPNSLNIPLEGFFDSGVIEKIPKDKQIVTVCPRGHRAMIANFALSKFGIESKTLVGGLAQWNQTLKPVSIIHNPVKIIQMQKVGKGCLSYIAESKGEAIVVDPLYPVEKYIEIAKEQGFEISKVVDTHQHADHVSSARELAKKTRAELYLSKYEGYDYPANLIGDGNQIKFGDSTLDVIHTPGHTPGSLSFLIDSRFVLTGDILFVESIGRPDLRDKAESFTGELYDSLQKLLDLPHNVLVLPAHRGENVPVRKGAFYSTIHQASHLPLLDKSKEEFVEKIASNVIPRPMNYQKIIQVNKGALELVSEEIPDMEIGPNRCAVNAT